MEWIYLLLIGLAAITVVAVVALTWNRQLRSAFRLSTQKMRESEKRFRDIADNAFEWIWEVDCDGKYIYSSPAVEKILGYSPEEMLHRHFFDSFYPDDEQELKRAAFKLFGDREAFREFENRNMHKNGKVVWLSTSGIPVIDETGELVGYRGADIDITERLVGQRHFD